MELHLSNIVVDCADPERLAAFWGEALGVGVRTRWNQYVILEPDVVGGPALTFQQVPEPKTTKNRLHLDIDVHELEPATDRLLGLGASLIQELEEDGVTIRVLADPEGNELCLVRSPAA